MAYRNWEEMLYQADTFEKFSKVSENFNDDIHHNQPIRGYDEDFSNFMSRGIDALIRDDSELIQKLI